MKRAALYLRVSTDQQTTENQRLALTEEATRRGWTITVTYEDAGISGSKGRADRAGLDAMLRDASRGKFNVIMAWALDRLGRNLADLIAIGNELESAHVDLVLRSEAIDTTSPAGKLFFHMMGAFAEFERNRIRERINAGLARARKHGTRSGNRIGRPKLDHTKAQRIRIALMNGQGVKATARDVGCGISVVSRIRAEMISAGNLTAVTLD